MKVRCENSHVEVFMRKQVEGIAWNRKLILRVYMQMTNNWVEDFVKKKSTSRQDLAQDKKIM